MAFDPVNDLERSLMKAAIDPAQRPQFYREFLGTHVFVIEHGPVSRTTCSCRLNPGDKIALRTWDRDGLTLIPVFSSLARLEKFIRTEVSYLAMDTPDLLRLTQGATLFLNPGSEYGKEFTSDEIRSLLDGSYSKPIDRYMVDKPTSVLIGQPARYPSDLVAALTRYFRTNQYVKRAYLAHFFNPAHDEKPHTLVAVEVSGHWDQVAADAGLVAREVNVPDPPVDFIQITGRPGIEDYFRQGVQPFYKRKLFGLF